MGWLNTSNEVTSVMLEISSAQIQKSLNAWIEAVRYFNLLAGEAIIEEFSNPKLAAYGMLLLAYNVENTRRRPELFSNKKDQDFIESTYREIRADSARMFAQLSTEDQAEVRTAEASTIEIVNTIFYMKYMEEAGRIRQAQNTVKDLEARNTNFSPIKMLTFNSERKKYQEAKKVVEDSALMMEKFGALEEKYGSIENAQKQRMNAEAVVRKFRENILKADVHPVISLQENRDSSPAAQPIEEDHVLNKPAADASSASGDEIKIIFMCRTCQKDIDKDVQYCPHCGEKIEMLMYRIA